METPSCEHDIFGESEIEPELVPEIGETITIPSEPEVIPTESGEVKRAPEGPAKVTKPRPKRQSQAYFWDFAFKLHFKPCPIAAKIVSDIDSGLCSGDQGLFIQASIKKQVADLTSNPVYASSPIPEISHQLIMFAIHHMMSIRGAIYNKAYVYNTLFKHGGSSTGLQPAVEHFLPAISSNRIPDKPDRPVLFLVVYPGNEYAIYECIPDSLKDPSSPGHTIRVYRGTKAD